MIKRCKVLLCLILTFASCFAIFSINNKFNYKTLNDNKVSIYLNNEKKDNIPSKNEAIFSKAICDDDVSVSWDNDSWGLLVSNLNKKVKCNLYFYSGPTEFDFDYTGDEQFFTAPITGNYKVELWGASGGGVDIDDVNYQGGLGGYTSGIINLAENQTLYVYVGGSTSSYTGGYNGGANGGSGDDGKYTGGGGATDIRINNGTWNDFNSLKSRIMVAAGGAGTGYYCGNTVIGGISGGLNGYSGNIVHCYSAELDINHIIATAGTQNSGGYGCQSCRKYTDANGYFGYSTPTSYIYGTGGGSGYYGGGTGGSTDNNVSSGAGGSSFISGHNGCDAIKKESTEDNIIHTGQSIHYSGLYFTNTVMIDGNGYNWTSEKGDYIGMPSHDESTKMVGNLGNGYAKITLLVD